LSASWPVWDPRVVVKTSSNRARSSPCDPDFPNPDLVDRFHASLSFSRIFEAVLVTSAMRHQRAPSSRCISAAADSGQVIYAGYRIVLSGKPGTTEILTRRCGRSGSAE
ncbi:MAG: hypothetical protein ACK5IP_14065, partial [Paracoccus sp. (in: a-proteobacteria)]